MPAAYYPEIVADDELLDCEVVADDYHDYAAYLDYCEERDYYLLQIEVQEAEIEAAYFDADDCPF